MLSKTNSYFLMPFTRQLDGENNLDYSIADVGAFYQNDPSMMPTKKIMVLILLPIWQHWTREPLLWFAEIFAVL